MKLKNILKKEPLFVKSFKLAKSNPSKFGLMILFDALFLASAFALNKLSSYFAKSLILFQSLSGIIIMIVFSLMFYLIILFVYSFFKYCILDFTKSLFSKTAFSFKRLGQFYASNIVITGIFFAIMLLLTYILSNIKISYQPFVFFILTVPYLLFLYIIINASHSLFYDGSSMKDSIKKGFKITFSNGRIYKELILIMVLAVLILLILFLGSGYLIRVLVDKNYNLYLSIYAYFKQLSIITFDIVLYFVILINRISFYSLVKENK